MNLCINALDFAIGGSHLDQGYGQKRAVLRKGGSFLCKFFPCGKMHEQDLLEPAKKMFRYTAVFKPEASRRESSEVYLYAGDFYGETEAN
jgi:23S rRNA (uridine2552-2'-O)-methyltransferase